MSVHDVLEERYHDLEAYLAHTYKLERQEVLDDVFIKTVGKIIRHAHKYDATKSSEWTWMVMIGRQVAWQVLERMDKKTGEHSRFPVDIYERGERLSIESPNDEPRGWVSKGDAHEDKFSGLLLKKILEDYTTPESILMERQLEEPCAGTQGKASTRKRVGCRVYKSARGGGIPS